MTVAVTSKTRRPSWMTPYGHEGGGDVFFDRLWPEWPRAWADEWRPSVDLSENDGKYTLKAELPGVNKDDISVSYNDGYVTVSGKRESENEEEGTSYHTKEVTHGSFSRSFRLPKKVDIDKVDASYKDGVLTVVLPHKEDAGTKKIEVK